MWGISYWILPLFASLVWLAMLLAMLLTWITSGSPRYRSMDPGQTIAYISDVGAQGLKPLFIAMSAVTVVSLDLAFIFERWLRHTGRLEHNTSWFQKGLSICSIIAAIAGAAGLILLAVFDTMRHPRLHDDFLILFMAGYIVSAIFICWEYQRLAKHFRDHPILVASFWIKLAFIIIELALAIAFGVVQTKDKWNIAAVLEWVIALIFTFYVLSFFLDFIPAVRTKHHQSRETEVEMATDEANNDPYTNGSSMNGGYGLANGRANGYTNGYADGGYGTGIRNNHVGPTENTYYPDGHPSYKPPEPIPASRNF